ncbi:MAG: alpha/beta fold hydrolase, partial [Gammaproteobacteria bacterium]|nr:alpha/beta fold hydrolase [Gammaproteobacteria bacterium]
MSQQPEARPQRLRKRAPLALLLISLLYLSGCGDRNLPPWFSEELGSEFSLKRSAGISSFEDYKRLEDTLFKELDKRVYLPTPTGIEHSLQRYSRGSISDPSSRQPNWNRSFELTNKQPSGAVLLLHGMTDSPYSLRALGETLHQRGYQVLGLRLPGHGTAPSGMLHVTWQDMSAAVNLAMNHLNASLGDKPIHIIGYSTGAALALDYVLQTQQGNAGKNP